MPVLDPKEWEIFLGDFPNAHLLQTRAWGEFKQAFGWTVVRVAANAAGNTTAAGAQILFRQLFPGLSFAYIPRGPVCHGDCGPSHPAWSALLSEVDAVCREHKAIFLKVEPDLWQSSEAETAESDPPVVLAPAGFIPSLAPIQPPRTLLVDLHGDEAQVLGNMKQKTRYNIRLAQKKGIAVTQSSDIGTFHRLMRETGEREAFGVHQLDYYQKAFELFNSRGECQLLLAEYEQQPLAGLMVFAVGTRAWYFYGASSNLHREKMPSYLLQWEAMRWARARGCTTYDLWGVPDRDESFLEANFEQRSDGLWGVYRFKRGFGGTLRRAQGPWDRPYKPGLFALYRWWVARKHHANEN